MKNSRLPTGCRETSKLTTFINAPNKTQAVMKAQVILQSADAMIGFTYALDRRHRKPHSPSHRFRAVGYFNFFTSTLDFRPLCSYFSRRPGGRSSGVPSANPPLDWK